MRFYIGVIAVLLQTMVYGQSIFDVARSGDISKLKELIAINPDTVNTKNSSEHTPLILATYNGQKIMAERLIRDGADVNYTFSQGAAIHGAAFKGHLEIVKLLVRSGARLDQPDQNKTTPLIYATLFGHTDIARFLFQNGADPLYADATGNTALTYAESLNNQELLTLYKP